MSLTGVGGGMHYTASKAGLKGISARINYELLSSGIRANIINPGVIDTPMLRKKYPDNDENNKILKAQIPIGRLGIPADIANLALFLPRTCRNIFAARKFLLMAGGLFSEGRLAQKNY